MKSLTFCFSSGVATLVLGLSGLVLSYTCCHLIQFDLLWQTIFVKIPVEITDPLDVDCDHSSGYWELSVVSSCRRHHVTWTLSILRILQEISANNIYRLFQYYSAGYKVENSKSFDLLSVYHAIVPFHFYVIVSTYLCHQKKRSRQKCWFTITIGFEEKDGINIHKECNKMKKDAVDNISAGHYLE